MKTIPLYIPSIDTLALGHPAMKDKKTVKPARKSILPKTKTSQFGTEEEVTTKGNHKIAVHGGTQNLDV